MSRRRQHPASVAARRARLYRASGSVERWGGSGVATELDASSRLPSDGRGASTHGGTLSDPVDDGSHARADEAA